VEKRLAARGVRPRVGSRSGEPPFYWENPDTRAPALRGVGPVYVSWRITTAGYFDRYSLTAVPEALTMSILPPCPIWMDS
jgi:hypothetical protein